MDVPSHLIQDPICPREGANSWSVPHLDPRLGKKPPHQFSFHLLLHMYDKNDQLDCSTQAFHETKAI